MYKHDAGSAASSPLRNREVTARERSERRAELKGFLFLTVVMVPVLAGVIIATYGLGVWIYQMFAGPPTG